jgi:hypothetical protein
LKESAKDSLKIVPLSIHSTNAITMIHRSIVKTIKLIVWFIDSQILLWNKYLIHGERHSKDLVMMKSIWLSIMSIQLLGTAMIFISIMINFRCVEFGLEIVFICRIYCYKNQLTKVNKLKIQSIEMRLEDIHLLKNLEPSIKPSLNLIDTLQTYFHLDSSHYNFIILKLKSKAYTNLKPTNFMIIQKLIMINYRN